MSSPSLPPLAELHLAGLQAIAARWKWIVGLGALLVVLGMLAIGASMFVTLATMVFFGSLMLIAGVLQTLHAITMRGWSGFFLDLVSGILSLVVGLMAIMHPDATAIGLTLLIAAFLIVGGIFRIATGIAVAYQNRMWLILHGVINLLLGLAIWNSWPRSGLTIIGLFLGIDLVFNGWSLIVMGLAVKRLASAK